jgi:hypothetical protein
MAHTFEYAVLTAVPDERRGERVNIGLVIFRDDRVDVRFKHAAYKLRALTGQAWDSHVETAEQRLLSLFHRDVKPSNILAEFDILEPVFKPSDLGWLSAQNEDDYERKVSEIIATLIGPPPRERQETQTRINTEIAAHFRQVRLLAKSTEGIETGRVVRNFPIAPNEGLAADFALRNGKIHVASTLDLRKLTANLGEAALKSIVLDKSEEIYKGDVHTIGVYAVDEGMHEHFGQHIELLGDYSQDLYNWADPEEQWQFKKRIYDAVPFAILGNPPFSL